MECYNINNEYPMGDCFQSSGGINKIYFANYAEVGTYTPPLDSIQNDSLITDIGGTASFYDFSPIIFEASYQCAPVENTTGLVGYEITLTIPFHKNEAETRNAMKMLKGKRVAMVKDVNGVWTILGEEFGLKMAPTYDTGTAMADVNRWTLVFKGFERSEPREIDPDLAASLIYVAP